MSISSAAADNQIEREDANGPSSQTDRGGISHSRLNEADDDISIDRKKSKKPKDSAFKQQRLPAWQPILTAGTVLPTFFIIGFAFIPIGIGMLWFSDNVKELKWEYHECKEVGTNNLCDTVINSNTTSECNCQIEFNLSENWEGETFLYYGLTHFYQNHRRYVKSRDDAQLLGDVGKEPSSECAPFHQEGGLSYVPCGAIANSMFSDEISMSYKPEGSNDYIPMKLIRRGIAWESDRKYKFKNPEGDLKEAFANTLKPKDWHKNLWELDEEDPENNGLQNEDLIVWMRTAALPNFRKLYRKINHTGDFEDGMPKGQYKFDIIYRFKVTQFNGEKSLILSTTSVLGGKNPFLGIAYITVGSICMIMGVVFLFIHTKCGKQTNDVMINPRTPYS